MKPFIETSSGSHFWLTNPDFKIDDIAHGLSNVCRFAGQCSLFYSVAEHSIMVSRLMHWRGGNPLEGLLHDAVEAYLCDIPAPFKQLLPEYTTLEQSLDRQLRRKFGLPEEKTEACYEADQIALFVEAYHLMPSRGECFHDPHNLRPVALEYAKGRFCDLTRKAKSPNYQQALQFDFLNAFEELVDALVGRYNALRRGW